MNEPNWQIPAPRTLLVATDLSPRCDRALDRAILGARQLQARLVVLSVIESTAATRQMQADAPSWRQPASVRRSLERRLRAELADAGVEFTVRIEEGAVIDTILRVAAEEKCDLLVTGVAHLEPLSRALIGTAVDALLRRSNLPLLVVRNRARLPYAHIAVASDFSASSCRALEAAVNYFPSREISIFHAFEVPFSNLPGIDAGQARAAARTDAARAGEAYLDEARLPGDRRRQLRVVIESGSVSDTLNGYIESSDVDLVLICSHGRSMLFNIVVGSTAKRIIDEAACDVLVVREPRAAAG